MNMAGVNAVAPASSDTQPNHAGSSPVRIAASPPAIIRRPNPTAAGSAGSALRTESVWVTCSATWPAGFGGRRGDGGDDGQQTGRDDHDRRESDRCELVCARVAQCLSQAGAEADERGGGQSTGDRCERLGVALLRPGLAVVTDPERTLRPARPVFIGLRRSPVRSRCSGQGGPP